MMASNCKLRLALLLVLCIGMGLPVGEALPTGGARLSPVVFIPGSGGSRLEARLDRPLEAEDSCPKKSSWHRLWLNVWTLLFGRLDCWAEVMHLHYNMSSGTSHNAPGVSIRVPHWGDTEGVEYLDPTFTAWALGNVGEYAAPIINELVKLGYVRGRSVRAAPYDFRYAPHSSAEYFRALALLIEETYRINEQTRVTILSHSLGGLYGLYFLNQQPQAWKDRYIHAFSSINTPWTGLTVMLELFASGSTFGSRLLDPWVLRGEQRSRESNVLMLPREGQSPYDWNKDEVLMTTPNRSYTVADLSEFFTDIGHSVGHSLHQRFQEEDYKVRDPGTAFHCIHSSGVNVAGHMIYEKGWDVERRSTRFVAEDGDGTINIRSLKGCQKVQAAGQSTSFHIHDIAGATHNGVLKDERLYPVLQKILSA